MVEAPLMEENLSDTVKEAMARIVKEKLEEFGTAIPRRSRTSWVGLWPLRI